LIGLASVATSDKTLLSILSILSKPVDFVMWLAQKIFGLSDGSVALMSWLGFAVFCMILGGLIGWGVSVVLGGDEE
jgi:hypothetical protein